MCPKKTCPLLHFLSTSRKMFLSGAIVLDTMNYLAWDQSNFGFVLYNSKQYGTEAFLLCSYHNTTCVNPKIPFSSFLYVAYPPALLTITCTESSCAYSSYPSCAVDRECITQWHSRHARPGWMWEVLLPIAEGLELDDIKSPIQPKPFHDSKVPRF